MSDPSRKERAKRPSRLRIRELRTAYVTPPPGAGASIVTPELIATILTELYQTNSDPRESLYAFFLDSRSRIIGVEEIPRGSMNTCAIPARDVLTSALLCNAAFVLVAHGHPSGDPNPSSEDILFTRRLADAARTVGVGLVDHVIVTASEPALATSLRDRGVL